MISQLIKPVLTKYFPHLPLPEPTTNAIKTVKTIQSLGRSVTSYVADVSKRTEVEALIAHTVKTLGPLNVMIANAGIAQVKPALELTEQDVERMFSINVFGVFNCYQAAAKEMIRHGQGGKIIGAARQASS
jgi:NAD(P)-dependent dehydrogenase (short-subunit alcohol dehydrogenase family)